MQSTEHVSNYLLPSQLTCESADALALALAEMIPAQSFRLMLDASNVEYLAASGAQVLASLKKSARSAGGTVEITGQKPSFSAALEDMGLGWLATDCNA